MEPRKGAISCPVCQCTFVGRYFWRGNERGKYRRCPNGHEFKSPIKPKKDKLGELKKSLQHLLIEVNCRIEHGAESGGHLEYVQEKLKEILK